MTQPAAGSTSAWRSSSPSAIEDDLKELWRSVGREGPVTPALLSNLVVLASGPRPSSDAVPEPRETLMRVAGRHPARIVLIDRLADCPAPGADAVRVGILTFPGGEGRYGVEMIRLTTSCSEASMPSIMRGLVRGNVPTSVWCGEDLSAVPPVPPFLSQADQFIYESQGWRDPRRGFRELNQLLADPQPPLLLDLTWRQLVPIRTALVTALAHRPVTALPRPEQVTIQHGANHESEARLVSAWLAVQFRWPTASARLEPSAAGVALSIHVETEAGTAEVADFGDCISVRDLDGRSLEISPATAAPDDAVVDALLTRERDTTLDRMIRLLASA
jgi:hypothetical protein